MRRIRFTIASLLVVVLFVAVGFAGLREANDLWDSGLFTLTLGVLLVSILLAILRTEFKRAFWLGFALFGSTYLTLSLVPSIEYRLPTKNALTYLDSKVPGRSLGVFTVPLTGIGSDATSNQVQDVAFSIDGRQLATSSQGRVRLWDATENFVRIGHSLFALLAGWFGGQLSRRLYRSSRSQEPMTAVAVEGTAL
jgi:WD40 repeat protein